MRVAARSSCAAQMHLSSRWPMTAGASAADAPSGTGLLSLRDEAEELGGAVGSRLRSGPWHASHRHASTHVTPGRQRLPDDADPIWVLVAEDHLFGWGCLRRAGVTPPEGPVHPGWHPQTARGGKGRV